jgi:hypothetical protein
MNSKQTPPEAEVDSSPSKDGIIQNDSRTDAQKVFGGKDLLTERPKDMVFMEYKFLRKVQTEALKGIFRKPPSRRVAQLMPIRLGYNSHPWKKIRKSETVVAPEPTQQPSE